MISSIRRPRERKQREPGLISCIYLFRLLLCSPVPLRLVQKTRPNPPYRTLFQSDRFRIDLDAENDVRFLAHIFACPMDSLSLDLVDRKVEIAVLGQGKRVGPEDSRVVGDGLDAPVRHHPMYRHYARSRKGRCGLWRLIPGRRRLLLYPHGP